MLPNGDTLSETVIHFDSASGGCAAWPPFLLATNNGTDLDRLLDTLQEVFGAEAIGAHERQALRHVFATVIAESTPEDPPTFHRAYQLMARAGTGVLP